MSADQRRLLRAVDPDVDQKPEVLAYLKSVDEKLLAAMKVDADRERCRAFLGTCTLKAQALASVSMLGFASHAYGHA